MRATSHEGGWLQSRPLRVDFRLLRVASIILPVTFLTVVDAVRHLVWPAFWHSPVGAAMVYGVTGAAVTAFAFAVFAIIERLEAQRARQTRWIASLQQLSSTTSSLLNLDAAMASGLDDVLRAIDADAGVACRVFPERGEYSLICTSGLSRRPEAEAGRAALARDLLAERVVATAGPVVFREAPDDPCVQEAAVREGIEDGMGVPLIANGVVNGIIVVAFRHPHEFRDDEREFLLSAGRQMGLVLHNAELRAQLQHEAVLEERERIAREMHDGLAQVLGYVNAQALAVRKLLADGETEQAVSEIGRLQTAARELYADVREGILALRVSSADGKGAISVVEEYIERYRHMFDVPVEFEAAPEVHSIGLTADVELQVVRIVQEALSNVRRHARPSSVRVRCAVVAGGLQIEVIDDGIGFDASHPPASNRPRFGLQTMEERARSVGGRFTITSAVGRGTRATVHVPAVNPASVPG